MEIYNYFKNVTADAKQVILENMNDWNFSDREELEEIANDSLWVDDSVTGNGSGSYTFNTWQAEENLCHNMDQLEEACNEFGQDIGEAVKQGAEYCDVTIRCYLLGQAISAAIDELEEEGKIQYQEEEELTFPRGFQGVSAQKALFHEHFIKKDDAIMKRRKRRLNPIYWIIQFLGGMVSLGSLFFIPYIVEKILGC